MNREQIEQRLMSEPDALEREYRPRPLPITLTPAAQPTSSRVALFGTGLVGIAVGIVAAVVIGGVWPGGRLTTVGGPVAQSEQQCRTADFAPTTAPWPDAPGAGGVRITLVASETANCVVGHGFTVSVADADGNALIDVAAALRAPIAVSPGSSWQVPVWWSTLCNDAAANHFAPGGWPDDITRPLGLSLATNLPIGTGDDGVLIVAPDTPLALDTPMEIAPDGCAGSEGEWPLTLGFGEIEP